MIDIRLLLQPMPCPWCGRWVNFQNPLQVPTPVWVLVTFLTAYGPVQWWVPFCSEIHFRRWELRDYTVLGGTAYGGA